MGTVEQYINEYILKSPIEVQKEFISDMWFSIYKTDEVTIHSQVMGEFPKSTTKKIQDLDEMEIQLFLGEITMKSRKAEEKLKEFKDKVFKDMVIKGEFEEFGINKDNVDEYIFGIDPY